jgi:hypothetical protein
MTTSKDDPNYQHNNPVEELIGEYEIECQGCGARRKISDYTSCGWVVGQMVGKDPSDPSYGRCFKCSRYALKVVKTPVLSPKPDAVGFTKIPQE